MSFFSPLDQFYILPLANMPKIVDYTFFFTEDFFIYKLMIFPYHYLPTLLGFLTADPLLADEDVILDQAAKDFPFLLNYPFMNILDKFSVSQEVFEFSSEERSTLNIGAKLTFSHFIFRDITIGFIELSKAFTAIEKDMDFFDLGYGNMNLWLQAFISSNIPDSVMNSFFELGILDYSKFLIPLHCFDQILAEITINDPLRAAILFKDVGQVAFNCNNEFVEDNTLEWIDDIISLDWTDTSIMTQVLFEYNGVLNDAMLTSKLAKDNFLHDSLRTLDILTFYSLYQLLGSFYILHVPSGLAENNFLLESVTKDSGFVANAPIFNTELDEITETDLLAVNNSEITDRGYGTRILENLSIDPSKVEKGSEAEAFYFDSGVSEIENIKFLPVSGAYIDDTGANAVDPLNSTPAEDSLSSTIKAERDKNKEFFENVARCEKRLAFYDAKNRMEEATILSNNYSPREAAILSDIITNTTPKFIDDTPRLFKHSLSANSADIASFSSAVASPAIIDENTSASKALASDIFSQYKDLSLAEQHFNIVSDSLQMTQNFIHDMSLYIYNTVQMFDNLHKNLIANIDFFSYNEQKNLRDIYFLLNEEALAELSVHSNLPLILTPKMEALLEVGAIGSIHDLIHESLYSLGFFERLSFLANLFYQRNIAILYSTVADTGLSFSMFNPYYKNPIANMWLVFFGSTLTLFGICSLLFLIFLMYNILFVDVRHDNSILDKNEEEITDLTQSQFLLPNTLRYLAENIYRMLLTMTLNNIHGPYARYFFPTIYLTFHLVLFFNLYGMLPYSFTYTSLFVITFTISLWLFTSLNIIGIIELRTGFFGLFMPQGVPLPLIPLLVILETISYFFRLVSVSVRLFANMMAGHTLLKVLSTFVVSAVQSVAQISPILAIIPLLLGTGLLVVIIGLELAVAFIQAYVFTVLFTVYINDALHGSH